MAIYIEGVYVEGDHALEDNFDNRWRMALWKIHNAIHLKRNMAYTLSDLFHLA